MIIVITSRFFFENHTTPLRDRGAGLKSHTYPLRDLGAGMYDFTKKKYGNSTPTQTSENINECKYILRYLQVKSGFLRTPSLKEDNID